MNLEAFLLCDAATDSNGKLNILGAFDAIFAYKTPVIHRVCTIALRIRFTKLEEGKHSIAIAIIDEDGKKVVPDITGELSITLGNTIESRCINLIFNLQGLKLEKFGEYSINLSIDNKHVSSLPFYLRKAERPSK